MKNNNHFKYFEKSHQTSPDQPADGQVDISSATLTRRQLVTAGLLGATALATSSADAIAATPRLPRQTLPHLSNIRDAGKMLRGQGLQRPGVVLEVQHSGAWPSYSPDSAVVQQMLSRLMRGLTRQSTSQKAWTKIVGPGDRVGILVDAEGTAESRSRKVLIDAVLVALQKAGVQANDIIVWCPAGRNLASLGYNLNWNRPGIKFLGADQMGYDQKYKFGQSSGFFSNNYHLSKLITQVCSHIINIATLEDHPILGCRLCLAQQVISGMSQGAYFARFWGGATGIGQISAWPIMRQRFVLHIIDGLAGTFNGALTPWRPQVLLGGTDPVAVDRIGFALIDAQRSNSGVPVITGTKSTPVHINHAALHGAGLASMQQIQHQKVVLQ